MLGPILIQNERGRLYKGGSKEENRLIEFCSLAFPADAEETWQTFP